MRTAVLLGATGLTGTYCLQTLLNANQYNKVTVLVRKNRGLPAHDKLRIEEVDFSKIADYKQLLQGDDLFCCIGTTIKNAGSQEAFTKVDYDIPVNCARLAAENGIKQFLVISSLGADAESSNFYLRTKGKMEEAVKQLPFKAVHIFRPSLLMGERTEFRLGERIAQILMGSLGFLFIGPLKKYKPIKAKKVSEAMVVAALKDKEGVLVYESEEIGG